MGFKQHKAAFVVLDLGLMLHYLAAAQLVMILIRQRLRRESVYCAHYAADIVFCGQLGRYIIFDSADIRLGF